MRLAAASLAAVLALAGCSFSQPAAPVRDLGPARRAAKPPPVRPDSYRVQAGDNLFRVALDHGLEYRQLAVWNGIAEPGRIRAGEVLRLKPPAVARPDAPAAEPEPPDTAPAAWAWPAKGDLVARFGGNAGANGIDIAGRRGSPVLAAAPGRVVYVGAGLRGYGKLIIIKHSEVLLTAYGHNERILAGEGQTVRLGQLIAEMGDSDTDRVKLHFEIREYGKPVDPLGYLPG